MYALTNMVEHPFSCLFCMYLSFQVAAVYKDPSVGNLINIMIVKLIIIHNEQVHDTWHISTAFYERRAYYLRHLIAKYPSVSVT